LEALSDEQENSGVRHDGTRRRGDERDGGRYEGGNAQFFTHLDEQHAH